MNAKFVSFDKVVGLVSGVLELHGPLLDRLTPIYLVRDLYGKVRILASGDFESDHHRKDALQTLSASLSHELSAHAYPAEEGLLFLNAEMLKDLHDSAQEFCPGIYWVDRLVTGQDWWTVADASMERNAMRYTLFSIKGGVGRTTTTAVLAWHLARKGERVLIVDLDLESPGLSSTVLDFELQPEFGVTDWFVEDLVEQGDHVIERMVVAPAWSHDFQGNVHVAPAHGRDPGDYLAKLGRVYMDTADAWTTRLERLLTRLEADYEPTIVLLESRSGLHDIAATTVTDLGADVLLFATDSESNWSGYDILFHHWQNRRLTAKIGERLSIVSALTPELDTERYLQKFRETAFFLFQNRLYEQLAPDDNFESDYFSFDIYDEDAPHDPLPIHWTRGLAAGTSLRNLERTTVSQAYTQFLERFDTLAANNLAYKKSWLALHKASGFDDNGDPK